MSEVINKLFADVIDDEIIEVTPENIRIRKKELDPTLRKKARRENRNERFKFAK
jgi:GTP-binding protein